jgi:hypothetical protein
MKIRKSYHIPTKDGGELIVSEAGNGVKLRYGDDPPISLNEEAWRGLMSLNYDVRFDERELEASDE